MNYTVFRDGQEFGPYSLSDLQRYVASGNIAATDMARSEGMTEAVPVSQIVGNIFVAPAAVPSAYVPGLPEYPDPPNLHWGLVLLFTVMSCGMFQVAWDVVLAVWTKKVQPDSRAIYYYGAAVFAYILVFGVAFGAAYSHSSKTLGPIVNTTSAVLSLVARFSLKNSLEEHYNSAEPIGLSLSGVMTFFFGCIYFQYHVNDIMRRKRSLRIGALPV